MLFLQYGYLATALFWYAFELNRFYNYLTTFNSNLQNGWSVSAKESELQIGLGDIPAAPRLYSWRHFEDGDAVNNGETNIHFLDDDALPVFVPLAITDLDGVNLAAIGESLLGNEEDHQFTPITMMIPV